MIRFFELINTGEMENIELASLLSISQKRNIQLKQIIEGFKKEEEERIKAFEDIHSKLIRAGLEEMDFILKIANYHRFVLNENNIIIGKDLSIDLVKKSGLKSPIFKKIVEEIVYKVNYEIFHLKENVIFAEQVLEMINNVE